MKKRIGLFTSKNTKKKHDATTTTTSHVEVDTVAELTAKLTQLGAQRVGLLRRDRLGATHLEGEMMAATDLKVAHLDWITGKAPEFETRGLFYEAR
ncbi:MAG: hypothetical protein ABIR80_17110 [Opitutaceae bacterium]